MERKKKDVHGENDDNGVNKRKEKIIIMIIMRDIYLVLQLPHEVEAIRGLLYH